MRLLLFIHEPLIGPCDIPILGSKLTRDTFHRSRRLRLTKWGHESSLYGTSFLFTALAPSERIAVVRIRICRGMFFRLIAAMAVCACCGDQVEGQTPVQPPSTQSAMLADPLRVNGSEFEQGLNQASIEFERAHRWPSPLTNAIRARVRADRVVTDQAVLTGLRAWTEYENDARPTPQSPLDYTQSLVLVDELLREFPNRPLLEYRLQLRQAEMYEAMDDRADAIESYYSALTKIKSVYLESDVETMYCRDALGTMLLLQQRWKEADDNYLQMLDNNWYTVHDDDVATRLRDLYISAGRGLIACRQYNLRALRQIRVLPSTMVALGPDLDAAINEAQTLSPEDLQSRIRAEHRPPLGVEPATRP
jgi:hypothetical protein